MAVRPRGLNRGGPGTAALFALALVLVSVLGALVAQETIRSRDQATDRLRIAADLDRFELALGVVAASIGEVSARNADSPGMFATTARKVVDDGIVDAVAVASTETGRLQSVLAGGGVAPLRDGFGLRRVPGLQEAVGASVADGLPRLVAPVQLERGPALLVVDRAVAPGVAADVQSRRAAAERVVIGIVRFERLRRPPGEVALWPGAEVGITTPNGVLGDARAARTPDGTVDAGGEVWQVSVGDLAGHRRLVGWYTLAVGLTVAATAYVTMRRQHDRQRRAEAEAADRSRQLELIADTSASLQQSLDLAELLPTFCVRVADEFALSFASVLVTDDAGELVEAFRYGEEWPGDELAQFELRRGWASVGRLVVRSGRPLDEVTTQTIQALSDLLAVAVSNAHLFLREQQAVTRLSELDALKNAFLGTVSHELRTSTTAVQGFGELLTEHWDTLPEERRRELAARIRRQAGSLRHLVDDLLDYARLEHQSLRVIPRQLSLSDLVRQLTESMSPLVADHEVRLETQGEVAAWADPIAVERILANLLSNAGKYAPAGTVVTVSVEQHGDRARLRVADQGPGIPPEERRRVFVRFYRLSNPETVRTRGAGIGLAILHDFAEYSRAEVGIDDAPGGGAVITVDFPTEPVDAPALSGS